MEGTCQKCKVVIPKIHTSQRYCKKCAKEQDKKTRNRVSINHYRKNKEEINKKRIPYDKEYYLKNKEKKIVQADNYYYNNRPRLLQQKKEYFKKNRYRLLVYMRQRRYTIKEKCLNYLGGKKCHLCGISQLPMVCYDFHHISNNKEHIVSQLMVSNITEKSWFKLRNELDKCIVLCANCHRIKHLEMDTKILEEVRQNEAA